MRLPSRSITNALNVRDQGSSAPLASSSPPVVPTRTPPAVARAKSQASFESAVPCVNSWPMSSVRTTTSIR